MTGADRTTSLAALRDADAAIGAVAPDRYGTAVPWCGDWTVGDVVAHLGHLHRWVARLLAAPAGERVPYAIDPVPDGPELAPWFAEGAVAVEAALTAVDPTREVGSWAGRQPAAWWIRRLGHEATLHAWDVRTALGEEPALDPALAVDAVDELFDVFAPRRLNPATLGGDGASVHLHATDAEGEWLVRFEPDAVAVTREHAKGDVAARGPAGALLLLIWSRRTPEELAADGRLEVFGDAGLLARWQASASF